MANQLFIGFDLGSSEIKATAADEELRILYESSVRLPLESPSRTDMTKVYAAFIEVLNGLKAQAGADWDNLKGLGIAAQGDGLWALGEDKEPVFPAYMWNDPSAAVIGLEKVEWINRMSLESGCSSCGGHNFPVLATYLKENRPEDWAKVRYQVHINDYINYKLTGELKTDVSNASTSGFSFKAMVYSKEFFEKIGIPEAYDMLLPVVNSEEVIGTVTAKAAEETGLPKGLPIIAGTLDQKCVALGSGVYREGDAMLGAGTTFCCLSVIPKTAFHPEKVFGYADSLEMDSIIHGFGATQAGAQAVRWVGETFGKGKSYDELDAAIMSTKPGADGLMFHPYIYGERAPFINPLATGAFFGLDYNHTSEHMLRAGYEGIAMAVRDCFEAVGKPKHKIMLSGGVSNSPVFCQIACDVLGWPMKKITTKQQGTVGAVKLLQIMSGTRNSLSDFADPDGINYEPDLKKTEFYTEWFGEFQRLRGEMRDFWSFRHDKM